MSDASFPGKKMAKILVFTSFGGGGHISASNALIEYLKDEHEVYAIPLFRSILASVDPLRKITFNKLDCEDFYNFLLRKKCTRLLNLYCLLALWNMAIIKRLIAPLIQNYLEQEKPDLIISVIPISNGVINTIAQSLNIPFLVIPTDLDSSTFIHNMHSQPNDNLFVGLAFNDPALWRIADRSTVYKHQMGVIGFPVRKSFFEPKDIPALKKEFNIALDKPVIFMLMGAVGSEVIYGYVKELYKITTPFHFIICLGRNNELHAKILSIPLPSNITITIMKFTDRISDLMAISDICISKAGSVSVCEALYMNKPMLLDCTNKSLLWEDFNIHFIASHGFGEPIKRLRNLNAIVASYLNNPARIKAISQKMSQFKKEPFCDTLKIVVKKLLKS